MKYKVFIEESNTYQLEIEAHSESEAIAKAALMHRDDYDEATSDIVDGEVAIFTLGVIH